MQPRFELLSELPSSTKAPHIATQFRMPSYSVQITFDEPVNRSITFDGWVCQAFAFNPGCTLELDAKLDPGIYCVHESPWVSKFGHSSFSERAPRTQHFLLLLGEGTRIDFATSKAKIIENSSSIEVAAVRGEPYLQNSSQVCLLSRCERFTTLPSISYEPADDLALSFQLVDKSTLKVSAMNDFTSQRQDVEFSGLSSFVYYWGLEQGVRPYQADFAEIGNCAPSSDAVLFAQHQRGLRSFYLGLPRNPYLEVVCRDYEVL